MNGSPLFEPLTIRGSTLANRIVFPAVVSLKAKQGHVTSHQIEFYERRALGGAGLIVTEGMSVHRTSQPHPNLVRAHDPEVFPGLQELAARVRRHGTHLLLQLWHVGRQQLWGPAISPWGVSALPDGINGIVPHSMSTDEVEEVIEAYVGTARTAKRAGFSGVEVHGAHGYLVTQFLSPWSNHRDDRYGGNEENRSRFLLEILAGIREACGEDFLLALKLTGSELVEGGFAPEHASRLANRLNSAGLIDMLTVAQGNFTYALDGHVPDMTFAPMPYESIIDAVNKQVPDVARIVLGRVLTQSVATELLNDGRADLIGLARPLIADPDLPQKWGGVTSDPVRTCIYCNLCWDATRANRPVMCAIHPDESATQEGAETHDQRTDKPIHVIGAGPAGLQAALSLAERGHRVVVWEMQPRVGGHLRAFADTPWDEYSAAIRSWESRLQTLGVDVRTGTSVDTGGLALLDADRIILATGSHVAPFPSELSALRIPVIDERQLQEASQYESGRVAVIDAVGSLLCYATAISLAVAGWDVTVVSAGLAAGERLGMLTRIRVERLFREHDVRVIACAVAVGGADDRIDIADALTGMPKETLDSLDLAVWGGHREPADKLWRTAGHELRERLTIIGDAVSPRDLSTVILEGRLVGTEMKSPSNTAS